MEEMLNSETNNDLNDYNDIVKNLYEKYNENEYMKKRLKLHLTHFLSSTLELEEKTNQDRINRTEFLTNEQKHFIQFFLNTHKYHYLPNSDCFYYYDGKTYKTVKEDIIQYNLLTAISKDRKLMDWKYKTKINIIGKIKERNLFHSVPESYTIQQVLKIFTKNFFVEKNDSKYFLTILGDTLLKKNNDLIYFVKPKIKKYLQELDFKIVSLTGINNMINNFVTKFHEKYIYENCRLIKMKDKISLEAWKKILEKNALDIICVATHYSQRYETADHYLNIVNNNDLLKEYTLYLKNNGENSIIKQFCDNYIELLHHSTEEESTNKSKTNITWKSMHYIWKLYISHYSLPNIVYSNSLKTKLREIYQYNEETDTFLHVTSKYIPFISDFIQYWERNITVSDKETDEWEMDEICVLFKKWCQENTETCLSNGNIIESDLIRILNHYFPNIDIKENKYILGFHCHLWNKSDDIDKVLIAMKDNYSLTEDLISFEDAYNFYYQYCNKNKSDFKYIVSKRYFEKYICGILSEFIEYNTFISPSWYKCND